MQEDWEINWDDYYATLGVKPKASQQEIDKAYKANQRILHPDRYMPSLESTRKLADEKLKKVDIAYRNLKDPEKRKRYYSAWLHAVFGGN